MTTDWLGGGLIVALAAVLWLIYLLPTWFRRNEFLSTERNVVRLQQTLRILAETSEVPDEVHVEANARSVAEQQRVLKKANAQNLLAERAGLQTLIEQGLAAQAEEQAARGRALVAQSAAAAAATHDADASGDAAAFTADGDYETIVLAPRATLPTLRQASLKLRRARAATSGILLLALALSVLGAVQVAINGAWVVLVVGVVALTLCVTRLGRLARDARTLQQGRRPGVASAPTNRSAEFRSSAGSRASAGSRRGTRLPGAEESGRMFGDDDSARFTAGDATAGDAGIEEKELLEPQESGASGWTPVPLPKPLYVGHRRIDSGMPVAAYVEQTVVRAEQALLAAARDSEEALRASQRAEALPEAAAATPSAPVASAPAAPSRFASMGVVDGAETGAFDVDLILAKRRAG